MVDNTRWVPWHRHEEYLGQIHWIRCINSSPRSKVSPRRVVLYKSIELYSSQSNQQTESSIVNVMFTGSSIIECLLNMSVTGSGLSFTENSRSYRCYPRKIHRFDILKANCPAYQGICEWIGIFGNANDDNETLCGCVRRRITSKLTKSGSFSVVNEASRVIPIEAFKYRNHNDPPCSQSG